MRVYTKDSNGTETRLRVNRGSGEFSERVGVTLYSDAIDAECIPLRMTVGEAAQLAAALSTAIAEVNAAK
ncbi:hypothetical protein [Thalassobius sp. Cn5-15]|uniref:hypothetical protein n=1 Tax=Thalassobius sp. Cn5-15 TaxID=2917763 RepID=UPI001EF2E3E8|nr:hypothetical protein [Thalassobius sp. Cn5-15]MCG7492423.1 hypothetical protein [Thalassobius sp. Cn5-15]